MRGPDQPSARQGDTSRASQASPGRFVPGGWPPPRQPVSKARLVFTILAVLLAPIAVWSCVVVVNDPSHYAAVLDELKVPPSWQLAHTETNAPGVDWCVPGVGDCPAVTRYYLVDGDPKANMAAAVQIVTTAGFEIDRQFSPHCSSDGWGQVMCIFGALRGSDHLWIVCTDRGESAGYNTGSQYHPVGVPGLSVVRIKDGPQY